MENNNADGAWTDAAKKAIAERSVLAMRYVAELHTTIEVVEHDEKFVAEIAERLKVMKVLDNAFDFFAGSDSGPSEERRQEVYEERIDSGLSPAEAAGTAWPEKKDDEALLRNELAVIDANPVGAEPGGPSGTHGLSQRQLMTLEFQVAPENILDASDPQIKQIGDLSREVISLQNQLEQKKIECEYSERRISQLQTMASNLNHTVANKGVLLAGLEAELREVKKNYNGLKAFVSRTAAYIAKAAPRTPSAKRTAFLKLADDLDKKVGISKKTPAKKTPAKKR